MTVSEGSPEPLGARLTPTGVNFAVYSGHASHVEVCLFDDDGTERRIALPGRTGSVFHGHVAGLGAGTRYGLRAHGPFEPRAGQRFNANKLLLDPYALEIDRVFAPHPSLFGYDLNDPQGGDSFDATDSAAYMPKAVVIQPVPATTNLRIAACDTVIYELHVRGFTKMMPDVPEALRGTFAGLGHPAAIAHLKNLGVTTIELLPTQAWADEPHLTRLGLSNYWGYSTVGFLAPDPRLAPGGWAEVRTAVAALAAAGIETLVDVVYNHSGEGDRLGPTLSLRGLDNAGYYRLQRDDASDYVNDAGTGNILALDRAPGQRLVMDSLRAWRQYGGVAGFRFDLAPVLGRGDDGFRPDAALLACIAQDPVLRELKMIAEPWDCGPGGYQLGAFPPAWGEWNDRFRNTMRGFWRGDHVSPGDLARRFAGSQDIFHGRKPTCSVNFITAHDGFTLADLVAYDGKHNAANGENNRDGTDDNLSWNHGVEGPSHDLAVVAARQKDQRNLLASLILARGTPMLAMGSEFGHSQGGNNNAYAQDNATSWLDWAQADAGLMAFCTRLLMIRRAHPALRADRFLTGESIGLYPDVAWRRADGATLTAQDWDDGGGQTLVAVLSEGDDRVTVIFHRGAEGLDVLLPAPRDGHGWTVLADTADDTRRSLAGESCAVSLRSVVVLTEEIRPVAKMRGVERETLGRLADAAGIARDWWSLDGTRTEVSPQSQASLLTAMGFDCVSEYQALDSLRRLAQDHDRRPLPFARVVEADAPATITLVDPAYALPLRTWLNIESEDGRRWQAYANDVVARETTGRDGRTAPTYALTLPPLEAGRYTVRRDDLPDFACALTVAPATAYAPEAWRDAGRAFGLTAQLYSLKRRGDQGIGDFSTLGDLAAAAGRAGAAMLAINPLHVLFEHDRDRASPYYPSDRRFLDPIHLDVPGLAAADPARRTIDYPGVWREKSLALEALFAAGRDQDGFRAFVAGEGSALRDFATFQALSDAMPGTPWQAWPSSLPAIDPERVLYHQYLQWLCETQFASAAARGGGLRLGLCRDLAVGSAPDGAETWAMRDKIAVGVSIGAPPDAFSPQGQVWGLPPYNPLRLMQDGYRNLAELYRVNMRHAGALRIDHAMGLTRQFWVPDGADGSAGAYVRFPFDDILGQLKLESQAAKCVIIGEDLGTVPEGFRETMAEARVLSYRVLPFERRDDGFKAPADYPRLSFACVSTHDLPPLRGWWQGVDISERQDLGLYSAEAADHARRERTVEKQQLLEVLGEAGRIAVGDDMTVELAVAIHAFIAATPAVLAMVQVEDLVGEVTAVNLPGTNFERPNWRRCLTPMVDRLLEGDLAQAILAAVRAERVAGESK